MFQKNVLGIVLILAGFLVPAAYAGKVELTTYYPAPVGEYATLSTTGDTHLATTSGNVGIGTTTPAGDLHIYKSGGNASLLIEGARANQSNLSLITKGDGAGTLTDSSHEGWFIGTHNKLHSDVNTQSNLLMSFWDGGAWNNSLTIDHTTGNVGIGTTTPNQKLVVSSSAGDQAVITVGNSYARADLGAEAKTYAGIPGVYANAFLNLKTCGTGNSGNTPYIDFSNDFISDFDMRIILTNNDTLDVAGGQLTHDSDSRIKFDQTVIPYGLNEIMKLRPKKYMRAEFKNNPLTGELEVDKSKVRPDIGLVAQEVYEVVPEAAVKPEDEKKMGWALGYDKLTPVLIKAVQEQQREIERQDQEIELLKKEISGLKK